MFLFLYLGLLLAVVVAVGRGRCGVPAVDCRPGGGGGSALLFDSGALEGLEFGA